MTTITVLLATVLAADPTPPTPAKEHAWLQQLVGEWEFVSQCTTGPGQPPMTGKGTETVKAVGGFWIIGEMKGDFGGHPMTGVMTVGYDAGKKKYVGSWVCSMCDWLCQYDGAVDAAGKTMTLECEGPSPLDPTKTVKMRDVMTLTDKDTRELKSLMRGDDGKWVEFTSMTSKRKK